MAKRRRRKTSKTPKTLTKDLTKAISAIRRAKSQIKK